MGVYRKHRSQSIALSQPEVGDWLARRRNQQRHRARRVLAAFVSAVVAGTMLGQAASYGVPWAGEWQPPTPPEVTGVKVTDLAGGAEVSPGSRDAVRTKAAQVRWPQETSARVTLPDAASSRAAAGAASAAVPGLPVRVGAAAAGTPGAEARAAAPDAERLPSAVRVQMAGRQATAKAGVDGLLMSVARDDTARHLDSEVTVEVDYSGFAAAYGGDWATRLTVVRLEGCALNDGQLSGSCGRRTPLQVVNDVAGQKLTARVPLDAVRGSGGPALASVSTTAAPAGVQGATLLAVSAGPSGANGDYTATSLSPAGTWQVSTQTGGFAWSHPLRMVPGVNGPVPSLGLSYSSQAVDGRTGNTNTQGSWIGDGWDMWPGFIERRYQSCLSDLDPVGGQAPNNPYGTGDLCWFTDNATMSLNGRSTELVKTGDGKWKGVADDGSRIERLTDTGLGNGDADGEYWKVTTTDGTQYFFGRHRRDGYPSDSAATDSAWLAPVYGNHPGEPGYVAGNFAGSRQTQAWRWNLDYVVDVHGNTMTLFYGKETGAYAREANPDLRTTYDRGGYLTRIEYGTRKGSEATATVPARVVFDVADRCLPDSTCTPEQPASWPDVPWDQYCTAAPCADQGAPTFWTQKRLAKVRTQVWRGSGFADVESWTLRHEYLDAGASDGEGIPMWLAGITHTGHVITAGGEVVSDPEIVFDPGSAPLANRVDGPDDGKTKLNRYRIQRIWTESGAVIIIGYSGQDCTRETPPTPHTNTTRCFPQWYGPHGGDPTLDWFNKYVVTNVIVDDNTGASGRTQTFYDYLDTPAWHYDDSELVEPDRRTWSQWRGYGKVQVRQGVEGATQTAVEYRYLRGMDGDRATPDGGTKTVNVTDSQGVSIPDHEAHAGFLRESITFKGVGGPVVAGSIHDPWRHGPTASSGVLKAWLTNTSGTRTRTMLEGGGVRWTKSATGFDTTYGLATHIDDLGDEATADDDKCTRYTYARNTSLHIVGKVSRTETVKVNCAATPVRPDHVLSDNRVYFDDPDTFGAAPTRGLPRRTETLDDWNGTTPLYVTTSQSTYDEHGRLLQALDELGRKTAFGYTPQTGGPVTATSATNALDQTSTTTVDPAWGQAVKTVDPNGHASELTYDGLGRVTAAWGPGRDKATQSANIKFGYLIRKDAPSAVTTQTLLPVDDKYLTAISLFDGQLRARQTQTQTGGGGRTISDTIRNSLGQIVSQSKEYYDTSANPPSTTLVGPAGQELIPGSIDNVYDGAGRPIAEIFKAAGVEKWRTSIAYGGDRVHVTPPAGGTASTTISNARGQTVELRHYHGPQPSGTYDMATYTHTPRGELKTVTDPAGNTWTWEYDLRGRKKVATDPDAGTSHYTYDAAGQLATSTDGREVTLGYTHDNLGRKTSIRDGSPTGPKRAEWIYDTLANGIGQLSRSIRYDNGLPYTTEVMGYDNAGRPTGTRVIIPNDETGLTGIYETPVFYRPDGSLARFDLPAIGGLPIEGINYSFNDVGQIMDMVTQESVYVAEATYNKLGELTQRLLGNYGNRTAITYSIDEPTGRLVNTSVIPEGQNEVADLAYRYDPAGNLTRIADSPGSTLPNDTQCFRYDNLRRLTQAWTPSSKLDTNCDPDPKYLGGVAKYRQDYTYDSTGNRTKLVEYTSSTPASTTMYTHPAAGGAQPHTVTEAVKQTGTGSDLSTYRYDTAGNMIERVVGGTTQTLTWTPEGQIGKTEDVNGTSTYLYDADGNRLIRRDPGKKTLYLPGGQELHSHGSTQSATRYYTHNGNTIAVRTNQGLMWTVTDHHNTQEIMIRDTDLQAQRRRSKPFGETRGTLPSFWAGDKSFVGGTNDPGGLTHLGARLYDPSLGRFTSVDPLIDTADPQQMHGYAYAGNNPTTWSDPDGLIITGDNEGKLTATPNGDGTYKVTDRRTEDEKKEQSGGGGGTVTPTIDPAVQAALDAAERAKKQLINAAKELLQIAMDELGITAALDCFTTGDLGACAETALNVASSFVGGLAGKLLVKYGAPWKWKKGAELVKRIWNVLGRIVNGVKGWFENSRLARRLQAASCNSFVPGTLVLMADGTTKTIEDIDVGDTVQAVDPETGESGEKVVAATIIGHGGKNLVEITIDTGGASGEATHTIVATDNHPFWAPDLQEWVNATDLKPGGWLQTSAGTWIQITAIQRWAQQATVHNLTITDIHTYYVFAGAVPVLVHNTGPAGPGIPMEDALDRAAAHVGGSPRSVVSGSGGVQFMSQEVDQAGNRVTKIARFDVNPNSAHVQKHGPHLNLETQFNGQTLTSGPLKDPHLPIDASTIRPGDYC